MGPRVPGRAGVNLPLRMAAPEAVRASGAGEPGDSSAFGRPGQPRPGSPEATEPPETSWPEPGDAEHRQRGLAVDLPREVPQRARPAPQPAARRRCPCVL